MPATFEEIAPALAKLLAPYVAAELRASAEGVESPPAPRRPDYDDATCAEYVHDLSATVLNRASDFFGKLRHDGEVDSVGLAQHLSLSGPRSISGALTTPLKQRAAVFGLERPWDELVSADGSRTVWADRNGIAARMVDAIDAERARRFGPTLTQPIRDSDLARGVIRIPNGRAKALLPPEPGKIEVDLRGERVRCRWNPRYDADQERSGTLRVGLSQIERFAPGERLAVELREGTVRLT